jgi:hypothetical protein
MKVAIQKMIPQNEDEESSKKKSHEDVLIEQPQKIKEPNQEVTTQKKYGNCAGCNTQGSEH